MTTDFNRMRDLYCKFEKFVFDKRGVSNIFQVPDIECSTSVESVNRTLLWKVVGLYKKLLSNNSISNRSNDIISNEIFSNGPYIFKSLNDQLAYHSKLYMDSLTNKDFIHQISYEVYDPVCKLSLDISYCQF